MCRYSESDKLIECADNSESDKLIECADTVSLIN